MAETVLFDPGIGELVIDFNEYINDVYSKLRYLKTPLQKRTNFKIYFPKIKKAIENNIAFYLGCLAWACTIKKDNKEKEIMGNVFLNMPEDLIKEYDYLIQVNFIEQYLETLKKDCKFFTNQNFEIPNLWINVLSSYKEFLTLNKGFVATKTTKDLELPNNISEFRFEEEPEILIEKAISEKNLNILLENVKFTQKA